MNDTRIDRMARAIATRRACAGLAAGLVGSMAGLGGAGRGIARGRTRPGPDRCVPAFAPTADPRENGARLQRAIDAANPGDMIALAPGIYEHEDDDQSGNFRLGKPLSIARCGRGEVVLRGTGNRWATLLVEHDAGAQAVTLVGLTITAAASQFHAPGIRIRPLASDRPMQVMIANCTVTGNRQGGISCRAEVLDPALRPRVELLRTTVSGNRSLGRGGGIDAYGCSLDVRASTIRGNASGVKGMSGEGGGIAADDAQVVLRERTMVLDNRAHRGRLHVANGFSRVEAGRGGGLHLANGADLVIEAGSRVTGNVARGFGGVAPGQGGGIYVAAGACPEGAATIVIASGSVSGNRQEGDEIYLQAGAECI